MNDWMKFTQNNKLDRYSEQLFSFADGLSYCRLIPYSSYNLVTNLINDIW
ncbi:hypothetical protein KP1_0575 [Klebsiella pneumoniae subsp. pneumoniae NTUH-K2044]|nr:hypothetical protein KP1_0575 [Klebsiella pneumoniae subsp. pneumoniae NTUH-K2044]